MLTKSTWGRNASIFSAAAGTSIIVPTRRPSGRPVGPGRLGEHLPGLDQLAGRRHHREHDARREAPRGLADRRQLVAQQVAVLEAQPDAALTEERVGLRGHRQVRQRLVAADVEGAQRDRAGRPSPRRSRRTPPAAPRRSARPLRSRKRNSVRTSPAPSAPAASAARASATEPRLAATVNAVPSRETAGCSARASCRARPLGSLAGALADTPRPAPSTASTCSSPVLPSSDDGGALGQGQHVAAGRHDHRDVPGPGQDRGVRGRAPVRQDHAGHQVQVQAGGLGGRQVVGDQDSRRRSSAARSGRSAPGGPARRPRGRPRPARAGRGRAGSAHWASTSARQPAQAATAPTPVADAGP